MKKAALVLSLALTAVSFFACDDDDNGGGVDASAGAGGGGQGGAGGGAPGQCKGTFASLTRTQLGGATKPTGACYAAADLDAICNNDIRTIAGACGNNCAAQGQTGMALVTCTNTCIMGMVTLSSGCSTCYANNVACTAQNCLQPCISGPSSAACTMCQVTAGCTGAFFTCSGLPGGPPSGTDGGVQDASQGQ